MTLVHPDDPTEILDGLRQIHDSAAAHLSTLNEDLLRHRISQPDHDILTRIQCGDSRVAY